MQSAVFDILAKKHDHNRTDYYAILGCDRSSTKSQIMAEYRWRIRQIHPDKSCKEEPEIFQEMQNAKNVLTNEATRRIYDAWLDCSIDVPWSFWLENSYRLAGLHWTRPARNLPMLTQRNEHSRMGNAAVSQSFSQPLYQSKNSSAVKKFRNYDL